MNRPTGPAEAMPSTGARDDATFRVVIFTCSEIGFETADVLSVLPGVDVAAVILAPHRRLSFRKRLRRLLRRHGAYGALRFAVTRLASRLAGSRRGRPALTTPGGTPILRFDDFHDDDCLNELRQLAPDLGVVDGTYILRESVFALPRLGSINLHCGKVPEFRGSPPAFWELLQGVDRVGVTIHRVAAMLDAGPILAEESFPLDTVPAGDPMAFVQDYWRTVLRPNGIRMIAETVQQIARGTARETRQAEWHERPNRSPGYGEVKALRRVIGERRST